MKDESMDEIDSSDPIELSPEARDAAAEICRRIQLDLDRPYSATEEGILSILIQRAIDKSNSSTYCAHCGFRVEADQGGTEKVVEHIRVCPKHPMRALEKQLAAVRESSEVLAKVPDERFPQSDRVASQAYELGRKDQAVMVMSSLRKAGG